MRLLKIFFTLFLVGLVMVSTVKPGLAQTTYYLPWEEKTGVDPHHDWTIKFNQKLDETTANDASIFVQHNLERVKGIQIKHSEDKKSIQVMAPEEGYMAGEVYFLYIDKTILSASGQPLSTSVKCKFTIKENPSDVFTMLTESELSPEQKQHVQEWEDDRQKRLSENWEETKGIYRAGDLYIVTGGWQPNPGYGIEVVKTETSWEQVTVYVRITKPNSGMNYPDVIHYPYLVGKINLPPYTSVVFRDAETGEVIEDKTDLERKAVY